MDADGEAELDVEIRRAFGAAIADVVGAHWTRKRLLTVDQMLLHLRAQVARCQMGSFERLVLGHLVDVIIAMPSLTRDQIRDAFEHLQATPGLPPLTGDASVFFALQDWLYGCPNAVLKALGADDPDAIDAVVPPERHLMVVATPGALHHD